MFILRKLLKVLLLPVAFVLFFIRWALEASVKLTEWAVGLLTLIVGAAIIYSIVIHRWGDLFLYSVPLFTDICWYPGYTDGGSCCTGFL